MNRDTQSVLKYFLEEGINNYQNKKNEKVSIHPGNCSFYVANRQFNPGKKQRQQ